MKVFSGRPSAAMIVAVAALSFALVGSAVAGTDGISSKLTKSKVKKIAKKQADKELKANVSGSHVNLADKATNADNATKATNATNADNATTAANATGLAGPLKSGQTLKGSFAVAGHKTAGGDFVDESSASFQIPLSAAPAFNYLAPGAAPTTQCPGSLADPQAAAGQLCFYAGIQTGATGLTLISGDPTTLGAHYFATGVATGTNYEVDGSWAVTAP